MTSTQNSLFWGLVIVVAILILIIFGQIDTIKSLRNDLNTKMSPLEERNRILEKDKRDLGIRIIELEDKLDGTLPYKGEKGNQLKLVNQDNVHNPTWDELQSFLASDTTETLIYMYTIRVCGDFAEQLHNNAEEKGIRAAIVFIDFKDDPIGHALNAFYTSDKGLVYIDDTPPMIPSPRRNCDYDSVCYIEIGKPLVSIDIKKATSLDYTFYAKLSEKWDSFDILMKGYNAERDRYNTEISSHDYVYGSPEYDKMKAWDLELDNKLKQINVLGDILPDCWTEPMGIVDKIEIYW